jgi:hypothetical protein
MRSPLPTFVTTATVVDLLMLSRQRLAQLEGEGRLQRAGPDKWHTVNTVRAYIVFMRDAARMNSGAANNRLREARAVEIEQRTAERLGKVCPIEDVGSLVDFLAGATRSEFGSLPARVTRDLGLRQVIEREVNCALARIADLAVTRAGVLRK